MTAAPLRAACEGPLHWSLGGEYALVALRRAADAGADVRLDFVGDGPDRERLLFAACDLGLAERVRFRPPGSGLAGAQLLILPAVVDGDWPVLERARAAGLAVLCSDLPGLRSRCRTALRVAPRDPEALAEALCRLAESPEWLGRLRGAGA